MRRLLRSGLRRVFSQGSEAPAAPDELAPLVAYTYSDLAVLRKLNRLAQDVVEREIPGDFVECGVCNGGSAGAIAAALRDTRKRAWLYDSFEGMPAPKDIDGTDAERYTGECVGAIEKVQAALAHGRFPEEQCVIRKGWFQDTFQQPLPETVALLHIDADWYDSVTLALDTFYDRVPEGGVIILDDFGCWEGCREAFYDFVSRRQIKPLLERFGFTQAFWVKGREHNRSFKGQWEVP